MDSGLLIDRIGLTSPFRDERINVHKGHQQLVGLMEARFLTEKFILLSY